MKARTWMKSSHCALRQLPWIGGVLVLASLSACSDDDTGNDSLPPADFDAGEQLECPADQPPFRTGPDGLSAIDTSRGIKVRVDEASDVPPKFGFNTWKVAVTDLTGGPLAAAQLTWACAYMSDHYHGLLPRAVQFESGMLELSRMNLRMTGPWDIRLWINTSGSATDFKGGSSTILSSEACNAPDGTLPNLVLSTCVPSM